MKRIRVVASPTNDEAGYPMVGWNLDDDHKISFGVGDPSYPGTWSFYLGINPGEDLYAEVDLDAIGEFGQMLVQMVNEAKAEEAERQAEMRRNVNGKLRSLWSQR